MSVLRYCLKTRTLLAKYGFLSIILCLGIMAAGCSSDKTATYGPQDGIVPDSTTAVRVAEAVWLARFGNVIYQSEPFTAHLVDEEVWVVRGTLPKGHLGGVPEAEIRKQDGCVLMINHGF